MAETPEHETRAIRQYVELETGDEVVSAEKVKTEGVFGTQYDVWDVRTEAKKARWWNRHRTDRWWVVTEMTNLYSFDEFSSVDQLLSCHIGLMHRIIERQRKSPDEEHPDADKEAWRRFGHAVDAFNLATEAEDFQGVGNTLRECLLAFARSHADKSLLLSGETEPQVGNFVEWSRLVARGVAQKRQRTYLETLARSTWDLTQALVHDRNAGRFDAEITLDATRHFLDVFGLAAIRHERGDPPRCPECGSYRLDSDFRAAEMLSYIVCAACGWERLDDESNERAELVRRSSEMEEQPTRRIE